MKENLNKDEIKQRDPFPTASADSIGLKKTLSRKNPPRPLTSHDRIGYNRKKAYVLKPALIKPRGTSTRKTKKSDSQQFPYSNKDHST